MLKRTIVALALIPVLLVIVLALPKILVAVIAGVFCSVSAYELLGTTKLVRNSRMLLYTILAAFFVALWSFAGCPVAIGVVGLVSFYAVLFSELMLSGMKIHFSRLALCMTGGLVVPCMLTALIRIFMMADGRAFILIPFVLAFMADIGAYFAGYLYGKHPLCPNISPKKTVEGMVGGIII